MFQQFEYNPAKTLVWLTGLPNLSKTKSRGNLTLTPRSKFTLLVSYAAYLAVILAAALLALFVSWWWLFIILLAPFVSVIGLLLINALLQKLVINPSNKREIVAAQAKLSNFNGLKIAVLGSYGKTSMKELLTTVLGETKNVLATPGNKNVLISHARWINNVITGNEDVLIFEYGESVPGDIANLARFSQPDIAAITGLAPAHLDGYKDVNAIADDLASISEFVGSKNIYVNNDSELLRQKLEGNYYDVSGISDWHVSNARVTFTGTNFDVTWGGETFSLRSGLLGKHSVGPLTMVAYLAKQLGLSHQQIIDGISKTAPFEHRMQARNLDGAWVIDDTYNGNIKGMAAGLKLLEDLPAKRRIYVTPGLVDQGDQTESIHNKLGGLIAGVKPDRVVLMQNSATGYIKEGLNSAGYGGELLLESKPLDFYTNLDQHLAAGDVVMMQNDWPDSYN